MKKNGKVVENYGFGFLVLLTEKAVEKVRVHGFLFRRQNPRVSIHFVNVHGGFYRERVIERWVRPLCIATQKCLDRKKNQRDDDHFDRWFAENRKEIEFGS